MATIRERQPGVWEVRVYVGRDPVTGAPRQRSKVIRAGRATATGQPPKAVRAAAAALEAEAAKGSLGGTNATVEVLLDRYFEHLERKDLSPHTLHGYRRYARSYIIPALGSRPVRKVSAWDLDRLYSGLADSGLSASSIRQTHAVLSGAFGQSVKWGWVGSNPAKTASPPPVRAARIAAPTTDEVIRILREAEARDPVLGALVAIAAITGARRGELCALRWPDVDLASGRLRISRSLVDLPGQVTEKGTKTHSERVVALGPGGVEVLRRHRDGVEARALAGATEVHPDGFLFSENLDGAIPVRPDKVTRFFTAVRDALDLKHVHFHSMRHYVASELAGSGDIGARTIAGRLGHSDASITLRVYAGFRPAADVEAAEHLGRLLGR